MLTFEVLYPDHQLLFEVDHSSNHLKTKPDGLSVTGNIFRHKTNTTFHSNNRFKLGLGRQTEKHAVLCADCKVCGHQ